MEMHFEVIVRQVENGTLISEKIIHELEIKRPENIIDIGFRHWRCCMNHHSITKYKNLLQF